MGRKALIESDALIARLSESAMLENFATHSSSFF